MEPILRPGTRYVCEYDGTTGPIWGRLKRAAARNDGRQIKKQRQALESAARTQSRTRQIRG